MDKLIKLVFSLLYDFRCFIKPYFLHVIISWQGILPKIEIYTHSQLVDKKTTEFSELPKNLTRSELIETVLNDSDGLYFVIFEVEHSCGLFVQFHFEFKSYMFDFPATAYNSNESRMDSVVRLLKKEGFTKFKSIPMGKLPYKKYSRFKTKWGETINADCGKDVQLAADLSEKVFSQIYLTKEKLFVSVG